jgi:hypothetical protein
MSQILKKIFYAGIICISLFEILNVYFIMPMPGSQEMNSIDLAYFLYAHRWYFRIVSGIMIISGAISAFRSNSRLIPSVSVAAAIAVISLFNFKMNAGSMFRQPEKLILKGRAENVLGDSSLVICVEHNGAVKAYPVRFLSYHHQVQDTVGELPVMVTYCNVCRTGRVYLPVVSGHQEKFRLVGMDHYNAMFEDKVTKSWWRQATGEAVAGPLKGRVLPEYASMQLTVGKVFQMYPDALVMQPDEAAREKYDSLGKFERGRSISRLTRTDSLSWQNKSWVIGVMAGSGSKAYDWNMLKKERVINDMVGGTPVVIALSSDGQSFAAFERPSASADFSVRNDTLFAGGLSYSFAGSELPAKQVQLKRVKVYQEFWHSWKEFHPGTKKF